MGQSALKRVQRGQRRGAIAPDSIITFLRAQHSTKTSDCVSAQTGISENTVRKWLSRKSVPNGIAVLTLIDVYGPEFLAAVLPRAAGWLAKAARANRQDKINADIELLQRALEALK